MPEATAIADAQPPSVFEQFPFSLTTRTRHERADFCEEHGRRQDFIFASMRHRFVKNFLKAVRRNILCSKDQTFEFDVSTFDVRRS